jgi:hypothetical protein
LKRAIERLFVQPLSNLMASGQIQLPAGHYPEETMARTFYPGKDSIGQRLKWGGSSESP